MNPRRAWLVLATGFLLGTAFGWWSQRWYERRPRDPEEHYQRALNRLSQKLDLTPEQKTAAAAALQAERTRIQEVRSGVETRLKELHGDTVAAIRRTLTPDQQKKLDDMEARFQQRMKAQDWRLP